MNYSISEISNDDISGTGRPINSMLQSNCLLSAANEAHRLPCGIIFGCVTPMQTRNCSRHSVYGSLCVALVSGEWSRSRFLDHSFRQSLLLW